MLNLYKPPPAFDDGRAPTAEATPSIPVIVRISAYISLGRERKPDVTPKPAQEATQRMAARLTSETGRARYRRRKAIVEPVIGWIKAVLGFRRFSLRGEAQARGEWSIVCLAVNLKRLHRLRMA